MSISTARSNLNRVQSSLADLTKKDAELAKKEVALAAKFHKASEDATKAKSASAHSSKLRDAERARRDLAKVGSNRADIAKKKVAKQREEHRYQSALAKEETKERKKEEAAIKKIQKEQTRQQSKLNANIKATTRAIATNSIQFNSTHQEEIEYDVFISHASEDKDSFVEGLATELRSRGLSVWYDNFTLKWGDKLRREIDKGLRSSRFGIVVLSKSFFEKEWPQEELDALHQMESAKDTRILPIWHNITKDDLVAYSPMLASRLGLNTSTLSTPEIADRLEELVNEA